MTTQYSLDTSAQFEIEVHGLVRCSWSDYLGGLSIRTEDVDGVTVSRLCGTFQDQAALFGILNGLYGLGYPLLSVKVLTADP